MTQSKDDTIDISDITSLDDILDTSADVTIDLGDINMGTTTTYWAGDSVTDVTMSTGDGTFTLTNNDTITIGGYDTDISTDWIYNYNQIDPSKVERMCKQYPALEKVWRNFKSVYDMCKQDYEGKKKAGELDDDIPF